MKINLYTLRTKDGSWLGRIILTSDGDFMSITDYGNFGYSWSSTGTDDFRKFIVGLDVDYFGRKMFCGICDISHSRETEKSAMLFAKKILPHLQEILKKEIESENNI